MPGGFIGRTHDALGALLLHSLLLESIQQHFRPATPPCATSAIVFNSGVARPRDAASHSTLSLSLSMYFLFYFLFTFYISLVLLSMDPLNW